MLPLEGELSPKETEGVERITNMYQKVPTDMKFTAREKEVEQFWKDNSIFEKSIENRKGCPTYTFYDGPPTANGKPHIGHVLTRAIKDMIPRYHAMKGCDVPRKAGWDTHGLPVELEVEKALGLDGKDQIEKYGMEPFIKKCKESVWQYKGMWEDFSGTVGFWADMDNPYITYEDNFIESEWWALKEIWKKGLLYKGFKVVPYCPRCGTPLSSHEVALGYKSVKERSAIVRFKVKDEDAYFLAWTTTPWTLLSNVGLCVNPDETYAKVKAADGYTYYMAKALLDKVLGESAGTGTLTHFSEGSEEPVQSEQKRVSVPVPHDSPYEILEEMPGKTLEFKEYEPLYQCTADAAAKRAGEKAFFVQCDSYVTMTDGTGIVHTAPAFGEDDARVGKNYNIAFVQMVDDKGFMRDETPFKGMRAKPSEAELKEGAVSADPEILKELDARGMLFGAPKFEHDYPYCWRCDTPLLYYARESWFIKMTAVKEDLIRNNAKINWIPPNIGKGRFGDWLENIQDWDVSRNRYWGTPLNVWVCEKCGKMHAIGSRAELKEMTGREDALSVELHRPYIDEYVIPCECGGEMKRTPEVIDCWFDSGAMPYAQHHYPFENEDLFKVQFPAQFISEAVDQTRGWFYSLHAESTLLFNEPCFENVIVMGLVQDENGQKMSKSKGNAVDPFDALATYGADAIRWYFYTNSAPWLPNKFSGKIVSEGQRRFLGTLWNTYAFFVLYANIDGFDASAFCKNPDGITDKASAAAFKLTAMDEWLLSRMNTMVKETDAHLAAYRIPEAGKVMDQFVDEMSNWYVRRSRERFWAKGLEDDKVAAYMTLYTALVALCKAAAPMTPFMTEAIYRNLVAGHFENAPESIHLCDYPVCHEDMVNADLEKTMDDVTTIVVLGRAARNNAQVKNRQPLARMFVRGGGESAGTGTLTHFSAGSEQTVQSEQKRVSVPVPHDSPAQDIILDELNVKEIIFTDDVREFTSYTFKPQLKTVGPKYGKQLGAIQKHLASLDGNAAMDELNSAGALKFDADGVAVELTRDDLLIDTAQKEGFSSMEDHGFTVVLDTTLTDELIEEGYVAELISKVQTMRKDAGFEVMDHIKVSISGNEKIAAVLKKFEEPFAQKVLAEEVSYEAQVTTTKEWDINGEKTTIGVERI